MGKNFQYLKISKKINNLIRSGVFKPGQRLPATRDLALQFGVNRTVIREAQIALQAQGVLIVKPRYGAYVSSESKSTLSGLPQIESFELAEAQALIAVESAAIAAPIIKDNTLVELETLISIMSGQQKTDMTPCEAYVAFHMAIARATNNNVIILMIESMWAMKAEKSNFNNLSKNRAIQFSKNNNAILKAFKDRDAASVRVAMRAHFACLMEALIEVSEQDALEKMQSRVSKTRSRFLLTAQLP